MNFDIVAPGRIVYEGRTLDTFAYEYCSLFQYSGSQGSFELMLVLEAEACKPLRLIFRDVTYLRMPECTPEFWVSEFQVIDARDRQLAGVRYIAKSEGGFVCNCGDVSAAYSDLPQAYLKS